jgi:1,4-alpha-glucan branching enzyme
MTTGNRARSAIGAMTDDGVRFSLFAPRVKQVAIQGSWNEFKSVPMAQASDGVWWISFPLNDGEYQYRFEVTRSHGEPKRVLVADPTGIRFAGNSYECSVIRVVNGQPVYFRYDWQYDDVDLLPNEKLIIYEMHIGDFRGGPGDDIPTAGTFERVIEKLDYLAELGITGLEFMPLTQAKPDDNWGYSQHSLFAVDNTFGTPDQLARLVDECHKRGIRVIHDGVYNHLHDDALLPQIDYGYWFYETNPDKLELHFGPKFNYQFRDKKLGVYPAREHALGAIHRWIGTFHMDGIRFDSTRALKHMKVIEWLNEEAHHRAGFKPFFTIAEHLPQDPKITGPDGPVDAAWHDNFYRQLNCTVLGVPFDQHEPFNTTELLRVLNAKTDGFASNYNTVHYLNNHDQERTMYLLGKKSDRFGEAAFKRNKLGATLLLTAPGIPMLWMGEEFGQATPRGEFTEQKPLDWSLLNHELNRDLWQHYRRLIALRKENAALCSDNFEPLADLSEKGIIAFKRWSDDGSIVIVVANIGTQAIGEFEITAQGIETGRWCEVISNAEIETRDHQLVDTLGASEAKVYLRIRET